MTQREFMDIKRSGKYAKQMRVLHIASDRYEKYLYLKSIPNLELEINRLSDLLNKK